MFSPRFSIDDGHPLDLKVAEILAEKGYKAIFYIPIKNSEGRPTLNKKQILFLSKHFEIGSHTYNHVVLTGLPPKKIEKEIAGGKETLEDIIGKKVTSFCPPGGKYNREVLAITKKLGITDVRSARIVNFHKSTKSGLWHPNLHLYPHPLIKDLINCGKYFDPLSFSLRLKYKNLKHLGLIRIFKRVKFSPHFWLHSWEIDKLGLWDMLNSL
mgnify:CR=1 FL=1